MKQKNNLPYIIILIIGLLAITFASVKFFKKIKENPVDTSNIENSFDPNATGQSQARGQRGGNRGNFKPLHGTVTSINGNTIVMKADDNSVKNISVSSDTRISKMTDEQQETLTIAEVKTGDEINVMAQDTTTGDITAQMIVIGTFTPPQRGESGQNVNPDSLPDNTTGSSSI